VNNLLEFSVLDELSTFKGKRSNIKLLFIFLLLKRCVTQASKFNKNLKKKAKVGMRSRDRVDTTSCAF